LQDHSGSSKITSAKVIFEQFSFAGVISSRRYRGRRKSKDGKSAHGLQREIRKLELTRMRVPPQGG
jgi:hypothetical protein